jgi:hypothetical protein
MTPMRCTIKAESVYTVTVNGVDFRGFQESGRLDGVVKLTNGTHSLLLLLTDGPLTRALSDVMGGRINAQVLTMPPSLLEQCFDQTPQVPA